MAVYSELIPIIVITGFLGSGKTTLLNKMLKHPSLGDAAVLINEFGDVGLDHLLVEAVDDGVVVLESGCICCTIREDLKKTILNLHDRRSKGEIPPFRRMVIETTGLADPAPILFTLMSDTQLRYHYRLGMVVATVDLVNGWFQLDQNEECVKQVTVADRIVLTKSDIAETGETIRLQKRLVRINSSADFITAVAGDLDVERLLTADLYDPERKGEEVLRWLRDEESRAGEAHDNHAVDTGRHDAHIHSFCIIQEEPIDWTAFGIWLTMLLHTHGEDILRVKGMLNVVGVETPVIVNGVHHIIHPPFHLNSWPSKDQRSRIVFIVRDLQRTQIEDSLSVFNHVGGALRPQKLFGFMSQQT